MYNFTRRRERPHASDLTYVTKHKGGWCGYFQGKPTDSECDALSNCCGYANGRFNEIYNEIHKTTGCNFFFPFQASNWVWYAKNNFPSLVVDMKPEPGAIMVWESTASDGHVCVVEEVVSDNEVIATESGWNVNWVFRESTYKNDNGIWGKPTSTHKFLGFIHCPGVAEIKEEEKEEGESVDIYKNVEIKADEGHEEKIEDLSFKVVLANLLKVKSLVTIILTCVVGYLALKGMFDLEDIYLIIISFFFGTSVTKQKS